ncbi:hypothetical protein [Streptomyces celluloflavus]|uniref:hypothetical protein n=1 Tax=Streptomyces celluloflavus TaxID=58344 RepID=UPI0036768B39
MPPSIGASPARCWRDSDGAFAVAGRRGPASAPSAIPVRAARTGIPTGPAAGGVEGWPEETVKDAKKE